MAKKLITFITGSPQKLREVRYILDDNFPYHFESKDVDLPEYQGEPDDIAIQKCKAAIQEVQCPVMVEDTCLCFNALGGLPGAYIKWFYKKLGNDGLFKMLHAWEDKSAKAVCTIAYYDGIEIKLLKGTVNGRIVSPRGPPAFGWDNIFQPDGYEQTYAELGPEAKDKISHRFQAVIAFKQHLSQNCNAGDSSLTG